MKNVQHEYEAKFLNIDQDKIKSRLKVLGGKLTKPKQLSRRAIFENNITSSSHSWVRLRDEGDKVTLTLKQVTDTSTIHGTKEIELVVNDFEKTSQFLEGIGLTKKRYQENYREEWRLGNVIYDFDTWPNMPTLLEIEGPDEATVKDTAETFGLDYSRAKFGSIDTIYLKEYGRDILKEETLIFKK